MDYYVTKSRFISDYRNCIVLRIDNWDDYGFKTSFFASYFDVTGKRQELGSVKIAIVGEECYKTADELPEKFTGLPDNAISLWQSAESYQMVKVLCDSIKMDIFSDLNDIAYNLELLKKYKNESVLKDSLMRAVTRYTIENQFHRITLGKAKLTEYSFRYQIKEGALLQFDVRPNSCPPSNIHVLIGGNGVGKTTLIRNMITSICDIDNRELRGSFVYKETDTFRDSEQFANVIGVSFSPFDDFSCIQKYENNGCLFTYIGTKKEYKSDKDGNSITNLLEDIEKHFLRGLQGCLSNITKREDLSEVIKILENDPMFYEYKLTDMIVNSDVDIKYDDLQVYSNIFNMMSSGHKVVLSIIVRCIDRMAEKTILFLDEPENHLHPPLVSSLIRSISRVLIKRNGVAIVSTHSPIVLQEVPKSCVWILQRYGNKLNANRPRYETFGENIGILANDVFRYEIQNSGFHALLKDCVRESDSYEDVLEKYSYQLGDEAKGLVRIMFSQKARGEL